MTRQRKVILEELKKVSSHPTAIEVYEKVRRRLPKISLGTVYRNLELLSEDKKIRTLEHGRDKRRFDGDVTHHHHVLCKICGKIDDIEIGPLESIETAINNTRGYQILDHKLELWGICPACMAQTPEKKGMNRCLTGYTDL